MGARLTLEGGDAQLELSQISDKGVEEDLAVRIMICLRGDDPHAEHFEDALYGIPDETVVEFLKEWTQDAITELH